MNIGVKIVLSIILFLVAVYLIIQKAETSGSGGGIGMISMLLLVVLFGMWKKR